MQQVAAGDIADLHTVARRRLSTEVVQIDVAVSADLETVVGKAGDGEVAADSARFVEEKRVRHRTDGLVHLACSQALQERQGAGPEISSRLSGVMSYIATDVRVRQASAAAIGEWNRAAHASRAGGTHSGGSC